jgi:tight adherence protein B
VIVVLSLASAVAIHLAWTATRAAAARNRAVGARRRAVMPPTATSLIERLLRGRRARALERALPDALDAIARSLRSGGSLRLAVGEAARSVDEPLRRDLEVVADAVRDGAALPDALEWWAADRPSTGVRLATAALSLGAETGGASAQAIDGVAATLRTNLGIAAEVRALSSQARLSALVIVLAPVAFSLMAATSDATTATFLFRTPFGLVCLALGLGLDLLGWLWMRALTDVVA